MVLSTVPQLLCLRMEYGEKKLASFLFSLNIDRVFEKGKILICLATIKYTGELVLELLFFF